MTGFQYLDFKGTTIGTDFGSCKNNELINILNDYYNRYNEDDKIISSDIKMIIINNFLLDYDGSTIIINPVGSVYCERVESNYFLIEFLCRGSLMRFEIKYGNDNKSVLIKYVMNEE